jgi:hypothetical protein
MNKMKLSRILIPVVTTFAASIAIYGAAVWYDGMRYVWEQEKVRGVAKDFQEKRLQIQNTINKDEKRRLDEVENQTKVEEQMATG